MTNWIITRIESAGLAPAPVTCDSGLDPVKVTLRDKDSSDTAVTWACLSRDPGRSPCDPSQIFGQLAGAGFTPNDFGCE